MPHENFFYSNLFIAIITLVAGLFGFILYYLRGSDYKRRTAKIIYIEITNAEAQLRDALNRLQIHQKTLPEHLYAMPSDTWTANKHLFVDNFKNNEWEALNDFYTKCHLFDQAIKVNDSRFSKDEQQIRENVQRASYDYAVTMFTTLAQKTHLDRAERDKIIQEALRDRDDFASFITAAQNIFVYTPSKQMREVEFILANVPCNLSLSSVGTKLEKLSKRRFFLVRK